MTQARWEQIYVQLQQAAAPKGYAAPFQLGGAASQTFEFRHAGKPKAIVAFRDLAKDSDYARPDRLWAEGLDLVLARYAALHQSKVSVPPAFAVVIDNIRGNYVTVPMRDLLSLYLKRLPKPHARGSRWRTFVIDVRGGAYYLVMPDDLPALPLPSVNTLTPIITAL